MAFTEEARVCIKCGRSRPLTDFNKNKSRKDGLRSECKPCEREYQRAYRAVHAERLKAAAAARYEKNREAVLEKQAEYRQGHAEALREKARRYYRENRDAVLAQQAVYYQANAGAVRARVARWVRENPDKVADYRSERAHLFWESRYRGRAAQFGFEPVVESFTREELLATHGDECYLCGGPFEELDHVVEIHQGGGHSLENCRPCCALCNITKSASTRQRDAGGRFLPAAATSITTKEQ